MIALPVRYSIERMKPFQQLERHPEWVRKLKAEENRGNKRLILFNYSRPIEAMFYTDWIVYDFIPDINTITELQKRGYTVVVNNSSNLKDGFSGNKNVVFFNLNDPGK
jgi:hypothetical protein